MRTRHKTYLLILFIATTSAISPQCPTNKECLCQLSRDEIIPTVFINCTINNNSVFNIHNADLYFIEVRIY